MHFTRDRAKYPAEGALVLQELDRHGFDVDYVFDGRLPEMATRLQVRRLREPVVASRAAEYKLAYERGDFVPPVVVTADWVLIDGAHRVEGARRAGRTTLGMFRIKMNYHEATPAQIRQLKAFAGASNNLHGLNMSRQDNEQLIADLLADGKPIKEIAEELHLPPGRVSAVFATQRGQERLVRLGIKMEGGISPSHVREIGYKDKFFSNAVMRAMAELVRDYGLSVKEVQETFRLAAMKTEDADRLEVIAQVRRDNSARHRALSPSRRVDKSAKLGRAIGFALALEDSPQDAVELDPRNMPQRIERLRRAITVMQTALDTQLAAQRARAESAQDYGAV